MNTLLKTLGCAAVLAAFGLSAQAQSLPDTLTIGTEGAYPPFNFTDSDGNVQGFEVDLGNALCAEMGVTCTWVTQDWDGLIPGLLARKYDAIMASLLITEPRKEVITFSDKYYQVPARFAVPKDSAIEISAEGLEGKVIGTQRATSFENFLSSEMPGAELRLYGTMDEAYLDLESGRVDAVMGDIIGLAEGFLTQDTGETYEMRGPEFTGVAYFGEGVGMGVRKEDAAIAEAASEAIKTLRDNGTYQDLSDKWFKADVYGG